MDILRGAWELNRTAQDQDRDDLKRAVWRGGGEDHWAAVILGAVAAGDKVLAHCGAHHAFTEFRQPVVVDGNFVRFDSSRVGNHVERALGDWVMTVFLHAQWHGPTGYDAPLVHPGDGIIDALMLGLESGPRTVGFDLGDSPFGRLPVRNGVYVHGSPDFRLGQFADGWIYTRPISECRGVTPIEEWIHPGNLDQARDQEPDPRFRAASLRDLERLLARTAAASSTF